MHERKVANPEWPIHDVLARRWSTRAFDGSDIEPSVLRSLFEAARWAPSSFNEQPWRFIVAQRHDVEAFEGAVDTLTAGNRSWAANASAIIFGLVSRELARNGAQNMHAYYDLGGAVAMMTVEATSRGLFVHQMAGFDSEAVARLFEVPDAYDVVVGLAIGFRGDVDALDETSRKREEAGRVRRAQSDFVFAGRFGGPWEDGQDGQDGQ